MISVPPIMTMAAMATPSMLPMPPSTTMATMVADSRKVKDSGEMNPCRAAKNDPAKPAKHRAHREGGELGVGGVDAQRAAGDLVLAQRLPGPPDRQPPQPQRDEGGDERERDDDVVEKQRAVHRREFETEYRRKALVAGVERNAEEGGARIPLMPA